MYDHIGITVKDYQQAKSFYEQALKPFGFKIMKEISEAKTCGFGACFPGFWIAEARSGDIVNPAHIAFRAASRAQVRQFYAAALAAGANDNGAPGFRPQYHKYYYGAFVLDPSGYNIEALFHWPEGLLEWLGFLWHSLISILGGGGGGGGGGGRGAATPKDD